MIHKDRVILLPSEHMGAIKQINAYRNALRRRRAPIEDFTMDMRQAWDMGLPVGPGDKVAGITIVQRCAYCRSKSKTEFSQCKNCGASTRDGT